MVEPAYQNPSAKTIGLFRRNITSLERLRATTVGREEILDDLINTLKQNRRKMSNQHSIFIGPRGIGKTHLLTILEDTVRMDASLRKRYTVIRFPEENNRILSFADFLLGVIELLAEDSQVNNWRDLYEELSEELVDNKIIDNIIPRLKRYNKETGKKLLILIENLNILFSQQIKKQSEIHRFRTFLMDSPIAVLVGTAASFFAGITDVGNPLYDFFDVQVLEEMSEDLTIELVKKNLEWEDRKDLIEDFDTLEPKIRSLHVMTGGNPRLSMMLYELIAHDNILAVKEQVQRLLDQVSPLYQERIKDLPPQERSLLETIAMIRDEARTPANIARKMRKSPQQISSLLKRMTKAGYLSMLDNPDDKRSKIYRIKEGFFDLWLFMSESRANRKRFGYLVDFLAGYYTESVERERKREELWKRLDKGTKIPIEETNVLSLLDYLSEVGDMEERFWAKLKMLTHLADVGKREEATALYTEIQRLKSHYDVYSWIKEQAGHWVQGNEPLDIRRRFDLMIDQWRFYRMGDLEKAAAIAHELGEDFSSSGLHGIAIEMYKKEIENQSDSKKKLQAFFSMIRSQIIDGRLYEALESAREAWAIGLQNDDDEGIVAGLNHIAEIQYYRGEYDNALDNLKNALNHCKEERDRAVTMGQIADILVRRGDLDEALRIRKEEELPIFEKIGDIRERAVTWGKIADTLERRGDLDEALRIRKEEELPAFEEMGVNHERAVTMDKIADILERRGDLDEALRIHKEEALPIFKKMGEIRESAVTMGRIADIMEIRGDFDEALRIRKEEQLPIFEKIGEIRESAMTMSKIANILVKRGKLKEALRINKEEVLPVFKKMGDIRESAVTMSRIADIMERRGDLSEALRIYKEEVLPVFEKMGEVRSCAVTMGQIADILITHGDFDEALRIRQEEQLPIFEKIGDIRSRAVAIGGIADILSMRGDLGEALRLRKEEMLPVFEKTRDIRSRAVTMGRIADILKRRGDLSEALRIYKEEVLPVFEKMGDIEFKAYTLWNLAKMELKKKFMRHALEHLTESYNINVHLGIPYGISFVGLDLGLILMSLGKNDEAKKVLEISRESFVKLGLDKQVKRVTALLKEIDTN